MRPAHLWFSRLLPLALLPLALLPLALSGCLDDRAPLAEAGDRPEADAEAIDRGVDAQPLPEPEAQPEPQPVVEPVAEPDPQPAPEPAPEPEPAGPERLRLVGFSSDDRFLFVLVMDPPAPPEARIPESGRLERHDVRTGERRVIDTAVMPAYELQRGVLFDARGETVVYARRTIDAPEQEVWLDRVAPEIRVWTAADQRLDLGRVNRAVLAESGAHLLVWPWQSPTVALHRLPDGAPVPFDTSRRFAIVEALGAVVLDHDGIVSALSLETGEARILAPADAQLIEQAGDFALLDEGGRLVAHDLRTRERIPTPLDAPDAIAFFTLDRTLGRAGIGVGQGVYGAVRAWALGADTFEIVEAPAPREAGGQALSTRVRLHADGLAFYPRATWVGHDLWDQRGGVAALVQINNCADMALPGRTERLLISSELGCATSGVQTFSLYDEHSLTVVPTGIETYGVRAVLADGRVLFNHPSDGGTIWDVGSGALEPLGGRLDSVRVVRAGTWLAGLLEAEGQGTPSILIAHPDGITRHPQPASVREIISTDAHVAWLLADEAGDTLVVRSLDDLR